MSLMKEYLMDKTRELADKLGIDEADFYSDDNLFKMVMFYAQHQLQLETKTKDVREEIKKAILTRTDEVVELIQRMLREYICDPTVDYVTLDMCAACEFSFLCEASTEYQKKGGNTND